MAAREGNDRLGTAGEEIDLRIVAAAETTDPAPGEPVSIRLADSSFAVEWHLVTVETKGARAS